MLLEAMRESSADVQSEVFGNTGVITLNRPRALNALSYSMIQTLYDLLLLWKDDSNVHQVVLRSNSDRAFCAGGDIRSVYESIGTGSRVSDLIFRVEYQLNLLILTYPKPYISLIDGICMGGGMGISIHGSHRVVTQRAVMAMPETIIGFFPDVGAGIFLNQCPGEIGTWLGVLGEKISAGDALFTGLATHYVPHDLLDDFVDDLLESSIELALERYQKPSPPSTLTTQQTVIDELFAHDTIEEILAACDAAGTPESSSWAASLRRRSPTSLKVSLRLLRRAQSMTASDVFAQDFMVSQRFVAHPDFKEGIRALLIDKDNTPRWSPKALADVCEGEFFEGGSS